MFGSYFFSILLHLALALLIFLWPSSPPVKLDQPMMQISVNMGAPGGNRMASPVLGPQGKPMPTKAAVFSAKGSGGRRNTVLPLSLIHI